MASSAAVPGAKTPVLLFEREDDKDVALCFDRRRVIVYTFTPSGQPKQQVIHDEWPAKRASVIDSRLRQPGTEVACKLIHGKKLVDAERVEPFADFHLGIDFDRLDEIEKDLAWRAGEAGWRRSTGFLRDECQVLGADTHLRFVPNRDPFTATVFRYLYERDLIELTEARPDPEDVCEPTDWIRYAFLVEATSIRRRPLSAIKPKTQMPRLAW